MISNGSCTEEMHTTLAKHRRFRSSTVLCCIDGCVFSDILKDSIAFSFIQGQCHIPEDLNLCQHGCENLESLTNTTLFLPVCSSKGVDWYYVII
jgi:hypothetical protein